jgi:hypothetical protein
MEGSTEMMAFGKTKEVTVASGRKFIIREQNGNDDDILSNPTTASDSSNIDYYLLAIIIKEVLEDGKTSKLTLADVEKFLIRDRVSLLMESRIFSIGNLLRFAYTWKEGESPTHYVEDLNNYVWDYEKPFPQKGEEGYQEYRIPPYQEGAYSIFEITLETGKVFRFNLMDRLGEKKLLKLPESQVTKNAELIARNLELQTGPNSWTPVLNFSPFTKKEMVELHNAIRELDKPYQAFTSIENPKTKETILYPILAYSDFFFPAEI